jgi:plasmid maintenance system antidote protein VapI
MKKKLKTPASELKRYMEKHGITGGALAKAVGISFTNINNTLHERFNMSFKTALKLEKYFRTDKRHFCMIKYEYDLYMLEQDPSFQKELTGIQAVRRMSGAAAKKKTAVKKR